LPLLLFWGLKAEEADGGVYEGDMGKAYSVESLGLLVYIQGGGGWGGGRTLTSLRGSVAVRSRWARDCLGVFVAIVNLWERYLMEGQWEDMRRWRMGESMGGD
jgi:hypothetical protein